MKNICIFLFLGMLATSASGLGGVACPEALPMRSFANELRYAGINFAAPPPPRSSSLQEIVVSGKVIDETGVDLPGVNVIIIDSTQSTIQGTTTDETGSFSITVPGPGTVLAFSFIGYERQEVTVGSETFLTVTLVPDDQTLEEIVVVGYGSRRRRDITSAVSVIDLRDAGEQPASNPNQILQGRAAGVVVKQTSGAPGGEFQVRVRGIGSLGAGSDPLYVIDGFVVGTSVGQNLNSNDIESVSVLKDAAATAIYGARGSNGVVLITTKQAKEGVVNVNLALDYGIQNIPQSRRTSMMNGVEFAQFKKEVFMDQIRILQNREPTEDEVPIGYRFPERTEHSTNWYDLITRDNAPYSDLNLTISSGTGPIRGLVSAGYYKEDGVVKHTDYDRFSLRTNLGGQVKDFINFGLNINASYTRQNLANTTGRGGVVGSSLVMDPRAAAYNPDGSLVPYIDGVDGVFGFPNPLYVLENVQRRRNISELLTTGFIELSFLKYFTFRTSANIRRRDNTIKEFIPSTIGLAVTPGSSGAPPRNASETDQTEELTNYSLDQLLTFAPELSSNHSLDVLVGYTAQQEQVRGLIGSGNTFPDDLVPFLGSASIRSANSYEFGWSLLAFLSRVNYSYKDKYLLTALFRREGSSRFGANNQYGSFPAASAGWRISQEPFMPEIPWLSDLMLRASWGITGNNAIGNYPSLAFVGGNNYILGNSFAAGKIVGSFANQDLRWEKSNQVDIGLDLSLFGNKLVFNFEYYRKITNDMLLPVSIPAVSGFTNSLANIGKVENHGFEIGSDFRTSFGQFNFRTNANLSINRNKILAIQGPNDALYYGEFYSGYSVQKVGRPVGMIYGYEKIGIFNTVEEIEAAPTQDGAIPGAMQFADTNGDGVISYDTEDMVEIGNPNPAFNWAWTLGGDYKQFDFSVLFLGAHDFDIYRNIESSTMNMDGVFNVQTKAKDRWRSAENPGPNPSDVHSQGGTSYFKWSRESSNRYVYDASYVWLKTVTIGYTLPSFTSVLSNARIFLTANNLFLFTKYPGSNPDVSTRSTTEPNIDDEAYPVPRTIAAGLKLNF